MCRQVPEYARLLRTFLAGNPHACSCRIRRRQRGRTVSQNRPLAAAFAKRLGATAITPAYSPARAGGCLVHKAGTGADDDVKGDLKPHPFHRRRRRARRPPGRLHRPGGAVLATIWARGWRIMPTPAPAACTSAAHRPKQAGSLAKLPEITQFAVAVGQSGGALSSEHGDGRRAQLDQRAFLWPRFIPPVQQVKQIFDPTPS